jgi:predicted DNA-binding transcriptional regulator AlpA
MDRELLTEKEVAKLLRLSRQTIATWRQLGKGPVYIRVAGGAIRYGMNDIQDFLKQRKRQSTK